jgi:hypothetical protein
MHVYPANLVDEEGEADYYDLKAGERLSALATSYTRRQRPTTTT